MASFHTADKPGRELYKYLIGTVVPRPIAWVSSRDKAGNANLAPFSFFNACGYNPPTLAFTVADREGEMKDTSHNILEHPEFIVHIVSDALSEQMNLSCGDYGPDIDEFAESGLTAVPGNVVDVPRVAEALVAFECRLSHHIRLGEKPPHNHHILGEILYWHLDDRLFDEQARNPIRPEVLQAVGRMGGIEYARTTDRFEIVRPVVTPDDPRSISTRKAALSAMAKAPVAGK